MAYLHRQDHGVDHDQGEDRVFERRRGDKPPDAQLRFPNGDVAFDGLRFESEFDAFTLRETNENADRSSKCRPYLILVQLAISVLLFSFVLKRHDNETDEDVHHEKGNDLEKTIFQTNTVSFDGYDLR